MMTTLLWVFVALVAAMLLLTLTGTRARLPARGSAPARGPFWVSTAKVGGLVALFRVSMLWYLTYREWTGTQSLSLLPLILTLYPEGLLLPPSRSPTASRVWLFSGLLAVGSLTMTAIVASLIAAASMLTRRHSR